MLVCAAAAGVAAYLCSVWYMPGVVERALSRQFPDASVSVQGARFSGAGVLIKGVAVAENEDSLAVSPILFAERVRLGFAPGDLLKRRVVVRSAAIQDAVLTVEFEKGRGWNLERLGYHSGSEGEIERLPVMRIERGAVRVRRKVEGRAVLLTTVGVDGQITRSGEAGLYGFSLQADERLALSGSRVEGTLRVGGAGIKSELSLAGSVRMPRTWILDNAWNLDDLELKCVFDRESVEVQRLGFRMAEGVGMVSGRMEFSRSGEFDVTADLAGFALSDRPEVDTAVYGEAVMELLGPWAERFLHRYRPRGLGDVNLRVQGRWDDLSRTAVTGEVICRDISVEDTRFPYRLEQMEGVIAFSGRSLTLNQLVCRHGQSELIIEGSIANFGSGSETRLRVVSGELRFDEDVYRALSPEAKRMWFAFSPSGTGAIDFLYRRFSDGRRTRRLAVDLIDAGAIYEYFPYPLEHMTGRLIFEPNAVVLQNLEAHFADTRKVRLDGVVIGSNDFSVRVRAEEIPVDKLLLEAMPQTQQNIMGQFEIEAKATVDVKVISDTTGQRPFDYAAHLEVEGQRLVFKGFEIPLEDVSVIADITQDAIELKQLACRYGQGQLTLSGQITAVGENGASPGLCLDVKADRFMLDERFWAAAEQEMLRIPPGVRLGGPVDIQGRWSQNVPTGHCSTTNLTVVCRDNPVTVDGKTSARVSGGIQIERERVRLEGFRVDELVLDGTLSEAMPERMRRVYERLDVTGRLDAEIWTAELALDEEGFDGIAAAGRVTLEGVRSGTTDIVDHLNGVAEGRIRLDADERIQDIEAEFRAEGFEIRGREVDRLSGRVVYDPNEGILAIRNFSAEVGGGMATGSAIIDISNEATLLAYSLGLSFEKIAVDHLIPPVESGAEVESVQRGKAAGKASLKGQVGQPEAREGRMSVVVSNMQLGKQSLIGKVLTTIQFREPKDYIFNRMEMEAYILGDEVIIDRIRIIGRPFVFHGEGRYNLKTNRIEMDLVALGGLAGAEPIILDSLLRGLGSAFWKIEIRGDMREADIRTISLPILQLPLELLRR